MEFWNCVCLFNFFFWGVYLFIYFIIIYGCVGSSFLCEGSPYLRQVGATLHRGARASHYCGLSCCGAQAPDAQAQQLWLTGPAAPRHVGSSQTRARTRVPCIGRQTLNHCATREARVCLFKKLLVLSIYLFFYNIFYFIYFYFQPYHSLSSFDLGHSLFLFLVSWGINLGCLFVTSSFLT